MKYYFQFTLLSHALYYLAWGLEAILERFPDAWFDALVLKPENVPQASGVKWCLLTILEGLCDLNQWMFAKSVMFDPKKVVWPEANTDIDEWYYDDYHNDN